MTTATMLNATRILYEPKPLPVVGSGCVGEVPAGFIFLRCDSQYMRLALSEIRYVEARKNYCRVVTTERIYMVLARLLDFADVLPSPAFCQVHRSYLVALFHVTCFDNKSVMIAGEQLPIGEHYRLELLSTAPVFNPPRRRQHS